MKSTLWIRSVQRENYHGPVINHSLLQLEQHQGTCGFPEECPVPKGLLGLFRKPEIPMVHGLLHLQPGRGAGLPQGLLDNMDPQQCRKSETPTGNFLGVSWHQVSSDSSPASKWNPKPAGSLWNFLVASSFAL